jgi:putative acetyltransferase
LLCSEEIKMSTITIRPFRSSDVKEIITLFRDTVRTINIRHYSQEQVQVWAPDVIDEQQWLKELQENITYVAEVDGIIVGFADMSYEGYLDRLYVHKNYQAKGIAFRLLKQIEEKARTLGLNKITTHASINAKKLAERMGFKTIKKQTVIRQGVELTNYVMEKKL